VERLEECSVIACRSLFLLLSSLKGMHSFFLRLDASQEHLLQMTYHHEGQELRVHPHPCDKTCQWGNILRPLAFTVFQDTHLTQVLVRSNLRKGNHFATSGNSYARWLCRAGENGRINILNVFLLMIEYRGTPFQPIISAGHL
jgi:hypothetical protein